MSITELYFEDRYFKSEVDQFVEKHKTTYAGAFKCMEIIEAYQRRLSILYHGSNRRLLNERIQ